MVKRGSNAVSVIDTATNIVLASVPVGNAPFGGIAVHPAGTFVYVANTNNNTAIPANSLLSSSLDVNGTIGQQFDSLLWS